MLRRTPFKSKLPPPRPAKQWSGDALPGPRPTVRVAANDRAVQPIAKESIVRSVSYLRYVASFPCSDCGIAGFSQAAHENVDKGMAMKVSDLRTFPLCGPRFGLLGCHQQFDLGVERSREERRALGKLWVERMQAQARADGRKEFL